jgi:hypothetical protein
MDNSLLNAARAAQILQSRWEHDPLRKWMAAPGPSPKQQMFFNCTKPEAALLGANRSGKSDPLAILAACISRFGNPNPNFAYSSGGRLAIADRATSTWVIGLTEKLVKEGIQPKIVTTAYTAAETHPAFIPPVEIEGWNINDQTWRLKNGSIITFKSADAGRDVFQSAARDAVLFDEICEWEVYKEATFRVSGAQRRLLIRLAATLLPPLGQAGGVSWYFPQKIKPWWAAGNKENTPDDQNPDPHLDIFTMGMAENPSISREEITRLRSMFPPDSPEARIRIDGELLQTVGGSIAYGAYNPLIHRDAKITPDSRDYRYPIVICVDFNVTPCVWEIAQYIDKCWYVFDEIRMDNCNIPDMVQEFRNRYPHHGAEIKIMGDWAGKARSPQSGKSNYFIMLEAFKGYPAPVNLYIPDKGNPPVRDRLNAVNRQLMGIDGRVGVVIGPACVELDADFCEVLRATDGGILKTKNSDSPYFFRTHASDALGYAIAYVCPVPLFVAHERPPMIHIPRAAGLRGTGAPARGQMGMPPAGYNADGRLRFTGGGGIMPPRKP